MKYKLKNSYCSLEYDVNIQIEQFIRSIFTAYFWERGFYNEMIEQTKTIAEKYFKQEKKNNENENKNN